MNIANHNAVDEGTSANDSLLEILARQRAAYLAEGFVTAKTRRDRLTRCIELLVDHCEEIADAINADYGCRSRRVSRYAEVAFSMEFLKHARKHVHRWMRPEKRTTNFPFNLVGSRTRVLYQPLGVVGVIGPWNFPVHLTIVPMASVLAAGNRVMLKPSEKTPATADLLAKLIGQRFSETEIAVVNGGPELGRAFCRLPLDHLLFTGGTNIGRHVMQAAAENLVPVTLELGGKCPVILGRSGSMAAAARSIADNKGLNVGQICISADHIWVPREKVAAFVETFVATVKAAYPTMLANDDYGSVLGSENYQRLKFYLDDARNKGAEIIEINPAQESFENQPHHKLPIYALLNVHDEMRVMQEEIFGPLLPIKTYDKVEEAIDYINGRDRPLGLYYFGQDRAEEKMILERTTSGGVTINDTLYHFGQNDAPFGGVGASGMGAYHGFDGFKRFSHAKTVYRQSRFDLIGKLGLRPPYGKRFDRAMKMLIRK